MVVAYHTAAIHSCLLEDGGKDSHEAGQVLTPEDGVKDSFKVDNVLELLRSQPVVPQSVATMLQRPRRKYQAYQRSKNITAVSNLVTLLEGTDSTGDVIKLLNDKAAELMGLSDWPWLPLFDALQKGPKPHLVIEVYLLTVVA